MAPEAVPQPPPPAPRLVRAIGRFDLTAAIVNGVIGSAIFTMPASQAALTGAWSPLAALVAGLGVLTIVLCFAEVASRFPEAGGPYLYAREAFGPAVGFQAGWLTFWIRVTALAANLNVFVEYAAVLVPALGRVRGGPITMAVVVAVITAINLVGVRQAALDGQPLHRRQARAAPRPRRAGPARGERGRARHAGRGRSRTGPGPSCCSCSPTAGSKRRSSPPARRATRAATAASPWSWRSA